MRAVCMGWNKDTVHCVSKSELLWNSEKYTLFSLYVCLYANVCVCVCVCYSSCGIYTVHVVQCIDSLDLYPTFLTFTLTGDRGLLQTLYSQNLFKKQIVKSKCRTKNTSREVNNAFVSWSCFTLIDSITPLVTLGSFLKDSFFVIRPNLKETDQEYLCFSTYPLSSPQGTSCEYSWIQQIWQCGCK